MTCNCATCILSGMFLYMTLLTCATIVHDRVDMCNYGYVNVHIGNQVYSRLHMLQSICII